MRRFILLLGFSLFFFTVSDTRAHGPIIKDKNGTSTNWSGYASVTRNVTDVKGTWTVPTVDCTKTVNGYSSAWVGIDGDNSNTVEQTGTEHDCVNGTPRYYAWYEMYPKGSALISTLNVQPGDKIVADVAFLGSGKFQLTLTDGSQQFQTVQKLQNARRTSAEWIMEAPWSGGVLPLADFQTIGFNGPINTFPNLDKIDMVGSGGLKAQTTDLTNNSFSVNWVSSN